MSRFSWTQQHNIIQITIPCLNPIVNKPGYFDLYISRSYIKFHLKSPKLFMEFDLQNDIFRASPLNKVTATPSGLELVFEKFVTGEHWECLVNTDKASARSRREISVAEVSESMQKTREAAEKKKIEMDRHSVSEQMRIDGEKKQILEEKLESEKQKAVHEIFSGKPNMEIFKDRTDLPATRESVNQVLKFTPKRDPNLPARESTVNEPPIPNPLKPYGGPIHETHPLFLKDKGNEFFVNGDYVSAINAYQKALRTDPKFVDVLLNLSAAYLKTFEFDKALETIAHTETLESEDRVKGICLARRGAALVWKGNLADGVLCYRKANELLNDDSLTEDIIMIERRRESNALKAEGDLLYQQGRCEQALEKYHESLEVDEDNEVTYANLAQVNLKLGDFSACLGNCDKALALITHNAKLRIKVLLRKATVTEDIAFVDQALMIDSLNAEARAMQKEFQEKLNFEQYDSLKSQADEHLKCGKAQEAIVIYKRLLSTSRDPEQKIALLTNISACYLIILDYHNVVTTVEKAFKLNPKPSIRLRLLCRRAKAYSELCQTFSAQCDLKEALSLDPSNQTIQDDLKLLASRN